MLLTCSVICFSALFNCKQNNLTLFNYLESKVLLGKKDQSKLLKLLLQTNFKFFLSFLTECRSHALGMENNVLPNSAITASTIWDSIRRGYAPWRARLKNVPWPNVHVGSWSAASNRVGEWLQIDLGEETVVTKLATQGRPSADQWVTSYKILFNLDSGKWEEYKENDAVKVVKFTDRHNDQFDRLV